MSEVLMDVLEAIDNAANPNTRECLQAVMRIARINTQEKQSLTVREAVDLFRARLAAYDTTLDLERFEDTGHWVTAWGYFYTPYQEPAVYMSFHA